MALTKQQELDIAYKRKQASGGKIGVAGYSLEDQKNLNYAENVTKIWKPPVLAGTLPKYQETTQTTQTSAAAPMTTPSVLGQGSQLDNMKAVLANIAKNEAPKTSVSDILNQYKGVGVAVSPQAFSTAMDTAIISPAQSAKNAYEMALESINTQYNQGTSLLKSIMSDDTMKAALKGLEPEALANWMNNGIIPKDFLSNYSEQLSKMEIKPATITEQLGAAEQGYDIVEGKIQKALPIGGSISWQHNNPLNIKFGSFAQKYGATQGKLATDGGSFAHFQTIEDGWKAAKDLLSGSFYNNLTLDEAMKKWSGGGYGQEVTAKQLWNKKIKDLKPDELQGLMEDMQRREGWTEGKVGQMDQSLNLDLISLAGKLPVTAYKNLEKEVNSYLSQGNKAGAQEAIDRVAINTMSAGERQDLVAFDLIDKGLSELLNDWDKLKNINVGVYQQWAESLKPFAKVAKSQKWVNLFAKIEQNQAKYRNSIYGASLTANELKSSQRFMVDPTRDDIETIRTKLQNMVDYSKLATQQYKDFSKGKIGSIEAAPSTSNVSKADNDYLNSLGLSTQ